MDCKAIQNAVSRDYITGKTRIEYLIESGASPAEIQQAEGKALRLKVVQWRQKRSLDANAYYWSLLTKLAEVLKVSKPCAHNMILRKYGQLVIFDGSVAYVRIPDTDIAEHEALEASTYHIRPTGQVVTGKDGTIYRTYVMLKGSSDYNTKEMTELIDGLVWDCKELEIETLPPEELARMMQAYEERLKGHEKVI